MTALISLCNAKKNSSSIFFIRNIKSQRTSTSGHSSRGPEIKNKLLRWNTRNTYRYNAFSPNMSLLSSSFQSRISWILTFDSPAKWLDFSVVSCHNDEDDMAKCMGKKTILVFHPHPLFPFPRCPFPQFLFFRGGRKFNGTPETFLPCSFSSRTELLG